MPRGGCPETPLFKNTSLHAIIYFRHWFPKLLWAWCPCFLFFKGQRGNSILDLAKILYIPRWQCPNPRRSCEIHNDDDQLSQGPWLWHSNLVRFGCHHLGFCKIFQDPRRQCPALKFLWCSNLTRSMIVALKSYDIWALPPWISQVVFFFPAHEKAGRRGNWRHAVLSPWVHSGTQHSKAHQCLVWKPLLVPVTRPENHAKLVQILCWRCVEGKLCFSRKSHAAKAKCLLAQCCHNSPMVLSDLTASLKALKKHSSLSRRNYSHFWCKRRTCHLPFHSSTCLLTSDCLMGMFVWNYTQTKKFSKLRISGADFFTCGSFYFPPKPIIFWRWTSQSTEEFWRS